MKSKLKSNFITEIIVILFIVSILLILNYFKLTDIFVSYGFVFLYGAYVLGRYSQHYYHNKGIK